MTLYEHVPNPHVRKKFESAVVADEGRVKAFNAKLAVRITGAVGTMACAYVFAVLALVSLPDAIRAGRPAIVSWIAQTFLQLVLLSIIIVGQNVQSAAAEKRAIDTYHDAEAVLHEAIEIQNHLVAQDAILERMIGSNATPVTG